MGSSDGPVCGDALKYRKILKRLHQEILRLNLGMMNVALTNSMPLGQQDASFLEDGVRKCERNSKNIERRVKKYWESCNSLLVETKDLEILKEHLGGR